MIAVDTNVLVRFIVDDDPQQCRKARHFFQRCVKESLRIYIPDIVICETVWVLSRAYHLSRNEIAHVLEGLFSSADVEYDSPVCLSKALASYLKKSGDFADYLILEKARELGCEKLCTFDKIFLQEKGTEIPG